MGIKKQQKENKMEKEQRCQPLTKAELEWLEKIEAKHWESSSKGPIIVELKKSKKDYVKIGDPKLEKHIEEYERLGGFKTTKEEWIKQQRGK